MTEEISGNPSTTATARAVAALKGPRTRRIGLWLAGLILGFGVVGYLAGPPLMKWLLVKQLSTELHRQVSIEQIDINPYALSARVAGVSVKAADGKEVAGFDELLVNLSSFSRLTKSACRDRDWQWLGSPRAGTTFRICSTSG
jgi:hypothetical protein